MTMPSDNQALLALLGDGGGVLPGLRPTGPAGRLASADPASLAFQTQMRMARALFTEPDSSGAAGSEFAIDSSIVGDSLLMDALSTITRLMEGRPSLATGISSGTQARVTAKGPGDMGEAALLGGLSAMFESGSAGVAAIGYDKVGGTSYGKYQIASKPGSMNRFLAFLSGVRPEWAERLQAAGPANTGSTRGAMPDAWRSIAAEDPEGFEAAQHDFIRKEYYQPARDLVLERTGLDMDRSPEALREVLWSTAVQHGPTGAADIFAKARQSVPAAKAKNAGLFRDLIANVYENRQDRFGSSTARVQQSVKNRLNREMESALNMLGSGPVDTLV